MAIILFDDNAHQTLLPLTYTRPVADLRIGILTIAEKWAKRLNASFSFYTQPYLQAKYPVTLQDENLFINGSVCPDENLLEVIQELAAGDALYQQQILLAVKLDRIAAANFSLEHRFANAIQYQPATVSIRYPEDIFGKNVIELRRDFTLLTKGRTSAVLSSTNTVIGDNLFAEEGAVAECSTFNTTNGPIYLGKNAEVWEGSNVRGSFAICHDSQLKMGTKIYGGTTIGPYCRIGGEVNNSVIWGHSSKGHEGYLGNSVLGEWCNIGADSNNSNLKNNYTEVKLWDYSTRQMRNTSLQFCGLIMADHVKCGINTMFNTGTVAGVSSNIFGAGYPPNHIPDFGWGGAQGFETYRLNKAFETIERVFARRDKKLDDNEKAILHEVYNLTQLYREV